MAEKRKRPNARQRAKQRRYRPDALPGVPTSSASQDESDVDALQQWQRRIAHAKQIRLDWETKYKVRLLAQYFLGQHTQGAEWGDLDEIYLNYFAATIQVQRPSLLPSELSFAAEAKPGQPQADQIRAKAIGGVLDAISKQDGHLMKSLRLAMMQAFIRFGVLKVCYDPTMEPNPQAGQPLLNDQDQAMLGQDGAMLMEPDEVVTDEVYRWQWVNARNMLLPDEGPDSTRWTWIAEEVEVSLDEAKDDTRFPAKVRKNLKANGTIRELEHLGSTADSDQQKNSDTERFRYYECWDLEDNRLYIWADGQDEDGFLVNEPTPDGVEGHPYALLLPIPIIEPDPSPYPKPLVYDWLPIQQQYNQIRVQQINAGKRAARKILYDESTFPNADEAQKFLMSSADLQGVKVNDIAHPPVIIGDGAQSIDVSRNVPVLLADWQRVTGATSEQMAAPDADTATQAVMAQQSAAVRDSELRTMVNEWLTEAGRKMLQLIQQTLTLELWVEMKGMGDRDFQDFLQSPGFQAYLATRMPQEVIPQFLQMVSVVPGMSEMLKKKFGQLKPLKVTRSDLLMEVDVQAVSSTIRPVYRAQLLQLVQLLGPTALLSPTLLEELLHSFELPQGDQISDEIMLALKQQRDQQAQMQQAQMQAKMGGALPQQPAPGGMPGQPQPQSAGMPNGTQNPLGAVAGMQGM
jgi:hypothetical protein